MKPKDAMTLGGVGLLAWGCYAHYPPLAAIVGGALLLVAGIASHVLGTKKTK